MQLAIKTRHIFHATSLPSFLALAMLCGSGTLLSAQTNGQMAPPETTPPQTMPSQDRDRDRDWNRDHDQDRDRDRDTTREELSEMDNFLDGHPEIAEQLRKDPSLINKREFVENHPALQEYLQKHPGVRNEFRENPNAFMHQENRYDRAEDRRGGDRDITRRQLAEMDRFLDKHPETAEQLRKDPSLINNRQFVQNHPGLQEYLQNHPGVREEITENPNAFMHREQRYDRREDAREDRFGDRDGRVGTGDRDDRIATGDPDDHNHIAHHDRDSMQVHGVDRDDHNELTSFGQFLGGHSNMAAQLSKDPSLANNKEYLSTHPELQEYLKAHPGVSQQLGQNPQAVMSSNVVQQSTTTTGTPTAMPKTKPPKQ